MGSHKKKLLELWSEYIHKRDKVCQWCGRSQGKLDAHHIISKGRCGLSGMFDIQNGVLLCFQCHRVKIENKPVEYNDWIKGWLHDHDLDYYQLRQTFEGAKTYLNKDTYNTKKKILEDLIREL